MAQVFNISIRNSRVRLPEAFAHTVLKKENNPRAEA